MFSEVVLLTIPDEYKRWLITCYKDNIVTFGFVPYDINTSSAAAGTLVLPQQWSNEHCNFQCKHFNRNGTTTVASA